MFKQNRHRTWHPEREARKAAQDHKFRVCCVGCGAYSFGFRVYRNRIVLCSEIRSSIGGLKHANNLSHAAFPEYACSKEPSLFIEA